MNYQTTLAGWHDFYSITGMAAASLVGLLFVGLSLHLRIVVTHEDVKALARVTLASLGVTLVLALFLVIPETNDPSSTGWNAVGVGAFGFALMARPLVAAIRSSRRALSVRHIVLRFGLAALSFAAVVVAGGILVGGDYALAFTWLVGVSVALLVGALRNSWDLLVSVGAATVGDSGGPASPGVAPARRSGEAGSPSRTS
ncbi:MAG: hypothetical protein WAL84_15695 [Candidatus Dormiibacterota bacterium]